MFKIGDIVEITAEADASGMLEFKSGKGYKVEAISYEEERAGDAWLRKSEYIFVKDESGRTEAYNASHFKLKEDTIVEKKECLFKEGQEVYCVLGGVGVVIHIYPQSAYPVKVYFANDTVRDYTEDGRLYEGDVNRALFFSPTVVTGATEPVFNPVLKQGDVVIAVDNNNQHSTLALTVTGEDEHFVIVS